MKRILLFSWLMFLLWPHHVGAVDWISPDSGNGNLVELPSLGGGDGGGTTLNNTCSCINVNPEPTSKLYHGYSGLLSNCEESEAFACQGNTKHMKCTKCRCGVENEQLQVVLSGCSSDFWVSQCKECEQEVDVCQECNEKKAQGEWEALEGKNYQRQITSCIKMLGVCSILYNYRCAAGYYGVPKPKELTNDNNGCIKCPQPEGWNVPDGATVTSNPGDNATKEKCYIKSETAFTVVAGEDKAGKFSLKANTACYHGTVADEAE